MTVKDLSKVSGWIKKLGQKDSRVVSRKIIEPDFKLPQDIRDKLNRYQPRFGAKLHLAGREVKGKDDLEGYIEAINGGWQKTLVEKVLRKLKLEAKKYEESGVVKYRLLQEGLCVEFDNLLKITKWKVEFNEEKKLFEDTATWEIISAQSGLLGKEVDTVYSWPPYPNS